MYDDDDDDDEEESPLDFFSKEFGDINIIDHKHNKLFNFAIKYILFDDFEDDMYPQSDYLILIHINEEFKDIILNIFRDKSRLNDFIIKHIKNKESPYQAYRYCYDVARTMQYGEMKGVRCPELENIILNDVGQAAIYAAEIIMGRWLEFEEKIKDGFYDKPILYYPRFSFINIEEYIIRNVIYAHEMIGVFEKIIYYHQNVEDGIDLIKFYSKIIYRLYIENKISIENLYIKPLHDYFMDTEYLSDEYENILISFYINKIKGIYIHTRRYRYATISNSNDYIKTCAVIEEFVINYINPNSDIKKIRDSIRNPESDNNKEFLNNILLKHTKGI